MFITKVFKADIIDFRHFEKFMVLCSLKFGPFVNKQQSFLFSTILRSPVTMCLWNGSQNTEF